MINETSDKNLVDDFVELMKRYTDSPEIFLEATGFWLTSALLGRFVHLSDLPLRYRWPNLFVVLSSPPAFMRRSTVMAAARFVYKRAYLHFLEGTGQNPNEEDVEFRRVEEFTLEGLGDHIDVTRARDYYLFSPEFGAVLGRTKRGRYLESMLGLLCRLYYGEGVIQCLSKRKGGKGVRMIPEGLFFTLLAGLQDVSLYFNYLMLSQGFLRRVLLVYQSLEDLDVTRHRPFLDQRRVDMWNALEGFSAKVAKRMVEVHAVSPLLVVFPPRVAERINTLDERIYRKAKENPDDSRWFYYASYPEFLAKLTALMALAEWDNHPADLGGSSVLRVAPHHLNAALRFLGKCYRKQKEALLRILTPSVNEPLRSSQARLMRIKALIGRGTSMQKLIQRSHLTKAELAPLLETLMGRGEVQVVRYETSGRPGLRVFTDDYPECLEEFLQELKSKGMKFVVYDETNCRQFMMLWAGR